MVDSKTEPILQNSKPVSKARNSELHSMLRCPLCRDELREAGETEMSCPTGHRFPVVDGFVNLAGAPADAPVQMPDHCVEAAGMARRTQRFILPWLRSEINTDLSQIRLLEDGCGIGDTVRLLRAEGVRAYGIDPGIRAQEWARLSDQDGFVIADGTRLPFKDAAFDAVTSSGVLEHVGETLLDPANPDRREMDPYQARYIEEMVRVLRPGGAALVAHPNGAFPVDFWHPGRWSMRPHRPYESWMPNAFDLRRWTRSLPYHVEVRFLPPSGYLAFDRVKAHWYGRRFARAMQSLFTAIDKIPRLASSPFNPWLITQIRKS